MKIRLIFLLIIQTFLTKAWRLRSFDTARAVDPPIVSYKDTSVICNFTIIPPASLWPQYSEDFYGCDVQNDFSTSNPRVSSVMETHLNNKTNDDVEVLVIIGRQMNFFPSNFENFFPYLLGIKIDRTDLMFISRNDFSPFPNLEYLDIQNSQLQVIVRDSFSMNTKLKLISLLGNSIFYIDSNVFDAATNLNFLYLSSTLCMFGTTDAESLTDVANYKRLVAQNCGDTSFLLRIVTDLYGTLRNNDNCNSECNETCDKDCPSREENLKKNLTEIEENYKTCEAEKEELQGTIQPLQDKLEDCLNPVNGTCRFREVSDVYGYACLAANVNIDENKTEIQWSGQHSGNFSNSVVETLMISNQNTKIIPKNPVKTFMNLKILVIENSKLEKIRKEDLNDLNKIERMEIIGNNISTIESGSFDVMTVLIHLELSNNNLNSLPARFFEKLPALLYLNLSKNKLKTLRFDLINSSNKISQFYANDNSLDTIDINFIWRLQRASIIDLSGNKCDQKFDKIENSAASFIRFFNAIVNEC